jgi:hypothetical protein
MFEITLGSESTYLFIHNIFIPYVVDPIILYGIFLLSKRWVNVITKHFRKNDLSI